MIDIEKTVLELSGALTDSFVLQNSSQRPDPERLTALQETIGRTSIALVTMVLNDLHRIADAAETIAKSSKELEKHASLARGGR